MKFILAYTICSAITGMCNTPSVSPIEFKTWTDCTKAGAIATIKVTNENIENKNSANPDLNKNANTVTADTGANTGSTNNKEAANGNIDQSYTSENLYETDNETVGVIASTMNAGNTNSNGETDHQKSDRLALEGQIQKN